MKKSYTATPKAASLDAFLTALTGRAREGSISEDFCVTCGGSHRGFRDALSEKEYTISGMCQSCQDSFFGVSEDQSLTTPYPFDIIYA